MTQQPRNPQPTQGWHDALAAPQPSRRLQAAMFAGTHPHPAQIEPLVDRCAVETEFQVRDTLTWALIMHDRSAVLDRVLFELDSPIDQARAQALHTISKIGDRRAWQAITDALLLDDAEEVRRTAWRAAAGLVPEGGEAALAATLATQFGRGDRTTRIGLSRAFAVLGAAALPAVIRAKLSRDPGVCQHAVATERLIRNPDERFEDAIAAADRVVSLIGAPKVDDVEL